MPGTSAATKPSARRTRRDVPDAIARAATMAASGARFGLIRIASDVNTPDATAPAIDPRDARSNAASQHAAHGTSLIG